jgi:GAF domain-containing protein
LRLRLLRESLEQQTATADVFKVISRSTFDLQTVLDTLVESAARLCESEMANIARPEAEGFFHIAATAGLSGGHRNDLEKLRFKPERGSLIGRVLLAGKSVHILDAATDPEYMLSQMRQAGQFHTMLGVPLMREGTPIGVLALARTSVRPYTESQIELLTTFADQAVIAIENVRLFDDVQKRTAELSESLQQQTATADVLKVISRSTFDLQTVLDTLVESAARLCDADMTATHRLRGTHYEHAASYGISPELHAHMKAIRFEPGRGSVAGRTVLGREVVHVQDVRSDPEYTLTAAVEKLGARTTLGVPLLREGVPIGVFILMRRSVRPFTDKQIELLSTFADQAVIAIKNVRLFDDVQKRTQELSKSLEDLRTAQDRLVQTEKLASLGQLTAGIAHEIKNPLNFVNNFSAVSVELIDELREALGGVHLDDKVRGEITESTSGRCAVRSTAGLKAPHDGIVPVAIAATTVRSPSSRRRCRLRCDKRLSARRPAPPAPPSLSARQTRTRIRCACRRRSPIREARRL